MWNSWRNSLTYYFLHFFFFIIAFILSQDQTLRCSFLNNLTTFKIDFVSKWYNYAFVSLFRYALSLLLYFFNELNAKIELISKILALANIKRFYFPTRTLLLFLIKILNNIISYWFTVFYDTLLEEIPYQSKTNRKVPVRSVWSSIIIIFCIFIQSMFNLTR